MIAPASALTHKGGVLDFAIAIVLIASFAAFITIHVVLSVSLAFHAPRWRGALAFFVPPLAPFWGREVGRTRLAAAWLLALVCYFLARVAGRLL